MNGAALLLANARIVLADEVIACGSVAVADGHIVAIGEGGDAARGNFDQVEDLAGDLLLPGLVELHTDHIEAH